ncbi:hypothetical protein AOB60_00720 [Streptomyces noursei]|uniref:GAF domain-containing protein n=1 Tax=Streptomyces noursei TaxID=1971 RepID=A0A2N8PR90_STRNR|nr:hypothetical protein AOB60_00720 [Streptomyces noursei]
MCRRAVEKAGLPLSLGDCDAFARDLAAETGLSTLVNVVLGDRQFLVGRHNPTGTQLPDFSRILPRLDGTQDVGFCPHVVARRKALPLRDVCLIPKFASNPVVNGMGVRSYHGAPVIRPSDNEVRVTICAIGSRPLSQAEGRRVDAAVKAARDRFLEPIR